MYAAQNGTICPTAAWNNTIKNVVGIVGVASTSSTYLYYPYDVFVDGALALYVADCGSNRIKKFLSGSTSSIIVSGLTLSCPTGVFVTPNGILYIIDSNNYRILHGVFINLITLFIELFSLFSLPYVEKERTHVGIVVQSAQWLALTAMGQR